MSEYHKEKLAWFIAKHLPKRILLYSFCIVHGVAKEGPSYDGEYSRAYKLFTKRYGLK